MAARKSWSELSPPYQKRMQRAGLNARNWNTKRGDELRRAARGHAKTPERPSQAAKTPGRFPEYVQKQSDEMRQLKARKAAIFGDAIRYKPGRSEKAAEAAPITGRTNRRLLRQFLRMDSFQAHVRASELASMIKGKSQEEVLEIIETDWSGDDWSFLFYH